MKDFIGELTVIIVVAVLFALYYESNPRVCTEESTVESIISVNGSVIEVLISNQRVVEIYKPSSQIKAGSVICLTQE
jgi:hypothetical protein